MCAGSGDDDEVGAAAKTPAGPVRRAKTTAHMPKIGLLTGLRS